MTPPSLSWIAPRTVIVPVSVVGHEAVVVVVNAPNVPDPQSNAYSNPAAESVADGSNGPVSESAIGCLRRRSTGR